MAANNRKQMLSIIAASTLAICPVDVLYAFQDQGSAPMAGSGNPTEAASQSASELQSLVAPIALYPDSLVAQILTASTFPDQVAIADYWLQQNKSLTGGALMQAVDKQSWDASVKALTEFPSVLENLAKNLTWTSSLGAKGNLKSSSQITVVQQSPQTIVIQPTNPQIVYVPQYNPTVVYGTPYVVPGYVAPTYSAGDVAAAGIIGFGAGIAVGALMSGGGGCCSWGYSSWNCGWHGTAVVYHGGAYYGNAGWHGGYYNGGYHNSYGYNNSFNSYNRNNFNSYNRNSGNTFNRNVSGNTLNVNRQASSNSWAHDDGWGAKSTSFSGLSGHSSGFGDSGGWSSKAESSRGWGSMRSGGFGGGRWGGGGGFGGGRWGGGGFRR